MTRCSLPEPAAIALAHSQRVVAHLNKKMQAEGGGMPFDQYMHEVLYAPGLGYYSAGSRKFGSGGDFITAPEISPLFGQSVARALKTYLLTHPQADLLELGPGSGKLAVDLLRQLALEAALPRYYYLLEVSADLRQRQQDYLAEQLPADLFARCRWLDTLPEALEGVVVANEVLDALAVQVFRIDEPGPQELWLQVDANQAWQTHFTAIESQPLRERIEALRQRYDLPVGYQSEINLRQEALLRALASMLRQGLMIFIDYGFNEATFYHPERHRGTLQCHYRHHHHDDPFWWPGLQDITSHVDFTALARCGLNAGLALAFYCHQADFLIHHGILTSTALPSGTALIQQSQALQKLLMPHEMGELFKVIVFHKACDNSFAALAAEDLRHTL